MAELNKLLDSLQQQRPAPWEELPDLALYMDQVISYMPRQLIQAQEGDGLTSAMVNNYIKDGLLPRAKGKRYQADHLAYLTAICAMKRVLQVKDVKALMDACDPERTPQAFYEKFRETLDDALTHTAECLAQAGDAPEDLAGLALDLALRSYADQLACVRVLQLLEQDGQPSGETDGKQKEKHKH